MIHLAKRKTRKARGRIAKKVVKKVVRRELSALEKNILWCFALESKNPSDVTDSLDLPLERSREEIAKLYENGYLMERGGLVRGYELTARGYEVLGTPGVKLESRITTDSLRSGAHAKLIVTARNAGNAPITDALIRIVAPKFLTISRYGSEYARDDETATIEFPLTHLNPNETQTLEFDLHGNLTSGTVASKYKVLVNVLTGGEVTDKKELGIMLLE